MLGILPKESLVLLFASLSILVVLLFPLEKVVSKKIGINLSKFHLVCGSVSIVFGLLFICEGFYFLVTSLFLLFVFWAFLFGFHVDRKYIYILALLFLIACPFLLTAKLDVVAEYSAILCYLLLVAGVLKDLFFDRIYEPEK